MFNNIFSSELITNLKVGESFKNNRFEIIFNDLLLVEGDVIKLIVENKTNMTADFNGNLQGRLQDA